MKKINILFAFAVIFMFCMSACAQKNNQSNPNQGKENPEPSSGRKTYDYTTIELIDRFYNTLKLGKWDNLFLHNEEEFAPIYIGDIKASIQLIYKPEKTGNRIEFENISPLYPTEQSLTLTIDTSRIIGMPMSVWEYYKKTEYRREFMAFPVFIENISSDTLIIGEGDMFPISIEAKDKKGKWCKILNPFERECGTDLKVIFLAPHQLAITAIPICEGSFRTEIRLVFRLSDNRYVYSNVIEGKIEEKMCK